MFYLVTQLNKIFFNAVLYICIYVIWYKSFVKLWCYYLSLQQYIHLSSSNLVLCIFWCYYYLSLQQCIHLPSSNLVLCYVDVIITYLSNSVYNCHLPTLLISDPDMIKQIFIKNFSNFTNRPVSIKLQLIITLSIRPICLISRGQFSSWVAYILSRIYYLWLNQAITTW